LAIKFDNVAWKKEKDDNKTFGAINNEWSQIQSKDDVPLDQQWLSLPGNSLKTDIRRLDITAKLPQRMYKQYFQTEDGPLMKPNAS